MSPLARHVYGDAPDLHRQEAKIPVDPALKSASFASRAAQA
jgi:hypothetical protein